VIEQWESVRLTNRMNRGTHTYSARNQSAQRRKRRDVEEEGQSKHSSPPSVPSSLSSAPSTVTRNTVLHPYIVFPFPLSFSFSHSYPSSLFSHNLFIYLSLILYPVTALASYLLRIFGVRGTWSAVINLKVRWFAGRGPKRPNGAWTSRQQRQPLLMEPTRLPRSPAPRLVFLFATLTLTCAGTSFTELDLLNFFYSYTMFLFLFSVLTFYFVALQFNISVIIIMYFFFNFIY
jgi:hypothetical protein